MAALFAVRGSKLCLFTFTIYSGGACRRKHLEIREQLGELGSHLDPGIWSSESLKELVLTFCRLDPGKCHGLAADTFSHRAISLNLNPELCKCYTSALHQAVPSALLP